MAYAAKRNPNRCPTHPGAVLLGKLFGDGPEIWVKMQAAYDTWHAQRKVDTRHIRPLRAVA